jgi:hypothetical protein
MQFIDLHGSRLNSPICCPEGRALAYVISLRHRFFRDSGPAHNGFQAGVGDRMRRSIASDIFGKEIGDCVVRAIGSPSGRAPGTKS